MNTDHVGDSVHSEGSCVTMNLNLFSPDKLMSFSFLEGGGLLFIVPPYLQNNKNCDNEISNVSQLNKEESEYQGAPMTSLVYIQCALDAASNTDGTENAANYEGNWMNIRMDFTSCQQLDSECHFLSSKCVLCFIEEIPGTSSNDRHHLLTESKIFNTWFIASRASSWSLRSFPNAFPPKRFTKKQRNIWIARNIVWNCIIRIFLSFKCTGIARVVKELVQVTFHFTTFKNDIHIEAIKITLTLIKWIKKQIANLSKVSPFWVFMFLQSWPKIWDISKFLYSCELVNSCELLYTYFSFLCPLSFRNYL